MLVRRVNAWGTMTSRSSAVNTSGTSANVPHEMWSGYVRRPTPRVLKADQDRCYTLMRSTMLRETEVVIESWRRHYNQVRPHASLGYRAPAPEVFVPALPAGTAAPLRPASPITPVVAPRPVMH